LKPTIVIDTNVFAVSEDLHPGAAEASIAACVRLAARVQAGDLVVALDTTDEILAEYLRTLKQKRSSGLAVKLARRLQQRKHDPDICRQIAITPLSDHSGSYEEVPAAIRDIDSDDQKFFAVASAAPDNPQVFAGLDFEWWQRKEDLSSVGLDIQFVCADQLFEIQKAADDAVEP
jgi:hypothetical protein